MFVLIDDISKLQSFYEGFNHENVHILKYVSGNTKCMNIYIYIFRLTYIYISSYKNNPSYMIIKMIGKVISVSTYNSIYSTYLYNFIVTFDSIGNGY